MEARVPKSVAHATLRTRHFHTLSLRRQGCKSKNVCRSGLVEGAPKQSLRCVRNVVPAPELLRRRTLTAESRSSEAGRSSLLVAAVSLLEEPIGLSDARPVHDPHGAPFVLGAATLDLVDVRDGRRRRILSNTSLDITDVR
jgi:hypothetical protein